MRIRAWCAVVVLVAGVAAAQDGAPIPEDFPQFVVPGHEADMATLRELYWLHYPGAGPKATLWDEWLTAPSLWPAVESEGRLDAFRKQWDGALRGRIMADDGYVATHQHASIAHQLGWPFPFWAQGGPDAWGWHFSLAGVPNGWHGTEEKTAEGWTVTGASDGGIDDTGWWLDLTEPFASVETPALSVDVFQAPFIQIRWQTEGLGDARPYLEWTRDGAPDFLPMHRMAIAPIAEGGVVYSMVPVYKHPEWKGTITGLRLNFGNATLGGRACVQAVFTQYDTRHNINQANFVRGCANYFLWTGDTTFLRDQIGRMRLAMRYALDEFHVRDEGVVLTDWVGHDGRTGIHRAEDGTKTLLYGRGVGNNYWDLLPFGHKDTYATIQLFDALHSMAALERAIRQNPNWNVPLGALALEPEELREIAETLKRAGNDLFWNRETDRYVAGIDADGGAADFGFTFLNLEAVYYDFASPHHEQQIVDWIAGDRVVPGDTSSTDDIYHWRFGPRATTKRNIEYYGWFWSNPESIPWGGQVQDGGAVFGFSFHDLMARLKVRGPDDAWARLQEILVWFREVQDAGGYRPYYETHDGTLQGGGTAGGLGCDKEFFESVLVPQIMLEGFLGFTPHPTGFTISPRLPETWESLTVTRIAYRNAVLDVHVTRDQAEVTVVEGELGAARTDGVLTAGVSWEAEGTSTGDMAFIGLLKGNTYSFTRK